MAIITCENRKLKCTACGFGSIRVTERYESFLCKCKMIIYFNKSNVNMVIEKKEHDRVDNNGYVR